MKILNTILAGLRRAIESPEDKSRRFVTQFVEPDMLEHGFGFGRSNTCKALIKLRVQSFEQLFSLSAAQIESIRTARGVGPKVFVGFQRYLAKRGVLPGSETFAPTTIETTPATQDADNKGERIDVV